VLHIIAAVIGRGRQKADLLYDDLRAITALASLSVDPRARSQRALEIESGSFANVIVHVSPTRWKPVLWLQFQPAFSASESVYPKVFAHHENIGRFSWRQFFNVTGRD
jgi:hypothetical protein